MEKERDVKEVLNSLKNAICKKVSGLRTDFSKADDASVLQALQEIIIIAAVMNMENKHADMGAYLAKKNKSLVDAFNEHIHWTLEGYLGIFVFFVLQYLGLRQKDIIIDDKIIDTVTPVLRQKGELKESWANVCLRIYRDLTNPAKVNYYFDSGTQYAQTCLARLLAVCKYRNIDILRFAWECYEYEIEMCQKDKTNGTELNINPDFTQGQSVQ